MEIINEQKIRAFFNRLGTRLNRTRLHHAHRVKDVWSKDLLRAEERFTDKLSATMFDPVKLKRFTILMIKFLIVIEIVEAFIEGVSKKTWSRFVNDLVVAIILYFTWEKVRQFVSKKRLDARAKIEIDGSGSLRVWDAFLFSILWTDEIYKDIPEDRRRLVTVSYILIALGVTVAFLNVGGGFIPLIFSGSMVLAAVNLLSWAVSSERGEKQLLQRELQLAHEVQTSLMPTHQPSIDGYDIAAISIPAKEVGGDHFDYAFLDSQHERFAISVFDVSGKGMPAAMAAVFTSGAYASELQQGGSASTILTRLNASIFSHTKKGQFVAFLLSILDVKKRSLTFADAGQTRPLVRSSSGVRWLSPEGVTFPLGMNHDSAYGERAMQLVQGDVVFLLSDGFTEAMNNAHEPYGDERLEECIGQLDVHVLSAEQIIDRIVSNVKLFTDIAPQHDDMTMVVVKVLK